MIWPPDEATASTQRLGPERYALDAEPPVLPLPDGSYPSAMPGITKVAAVYGKAGSQDVV